MVRQVIAKKIEAGNKSFRLRGHEVKRIEAFSDAVFAFAVTLLIVSLEVPKSFEELVITMRGFFAFGICFTLLMMIWFEQNIFFRRYGIDDTLCTVLNCILIFLVLFFVYPLKFLFTLIFSSFIYGEANSPFDMGPQDSSQLMLVYGSGYIFIYLLFAFMYMHALRKKEVLELSGSEEYDTRTKIYSFYILVAIGVLSVIMSQLLSNEKAGLAGLIYVLIGPAFSVFYRIRTKKKKKLFKVVS
ncbi:MAG: TMEM175 family protein [Panacibacter sp.]